MTVTMLNAHDVEEVETPSTLTRVVNCVLGTDNSARVLTVVTFMVRFLITMLIVAQHIDHSSAIGTYLGVKFFTMVGSMAIIIVRWGEFMNYQDKDRRRAMRALRSIPITLAVAAIGGWQFFTIF